MIKAVIFDFDEVIHDTFEFHRMKLKEFTGHEISEEEYRAIHDGNFYEHKDNVFINTDWEGYVKFIHPEQAAMKIRDEIRQVLIELSQKYELFIISSGCAKNISDYLGNNGISKIFTDVLGFENHRSKQPTEESGSTIVRNIYECFRMLGDALLVARGIESENHVMSINELLKLDVDTSRPIYLIDNLRRLRHNVNHYGYKSKLSEVCDTISIAENCFDSLIEGVIKKISEVS